MQSNFAIFLRTAISAALAAGCVFAQSTPSIKFSDTFASSPSPLWSNYSGNWTASKGQYFAQVPNNDPLTYTGLPFDLTNFKLTVTVNNLADGGIWLRSSESDPYGNSILLVLGGGGYGQGIRGGTAGTSVYFVTPAGGNVNEVDGVFTPGDTYTITVTATGDTYAVYVNDSTTPVTTLVDSSFPQGHVGLYDDQPNITTGSGSGPATTFSNFNLVGRPVNPTVNSFSPESAAVGAQVKIAGTNLQYASTVTFNGKPAKFKQVYPSTEIIAVVPAGATTGPIAVTTPLGTYASTADFTVLP